MSRSAGAGHPLTFKCAKSHRDRVLRTGVPHRVTLTGRERPNADGRGRPEGSRADNVRREYRCSCGHVGWSNHRDLRRMVG